MNNEKIFFATLLIIAGLGFNVTRVHAEEANLIDASARIETVAVPVFFAEVEAIKEPNIRVAIWKTKELVKFQSPFEYQVFVGDELKGVLPANEMASVVYKNEKYFFKSKSLSFDNKDFIRLSPVDHGSYFTVLNLTRKTSSKSKINYNSYRGEMIYRYSPRMKTSFAINELPLDSYVAGIGEAPNESPMEYLRALLVAARSYGYFYINDGDNNKKFFDVYASTIDQLYLGYTCEIKRPNVADAAASTYGEVVTYNDSPVITPYFGNSNGSTLTWKEVWGGLNKPWIKPVTCAYDEGKKKWGHGVGMSTHDALHRAGDDGWGYGQLLTYYFTNTLVERIY